MDFRNILFFVGVYIDFFIKSKDEIALSGQVGEGIAVSNFICCLKCHIMTSYESIFAGVKKIRKNLTDNQKMITFNYVQCDHN